MIGTGQVDTVVLLGSTSDRVKGLGQKKPAGGGGGLDGKKEWSYSE